ncbi:MAG: ABC transporter permease [Dehalococcoidales bacterium]|nr:ABC transporter permease [Dehalococcoidales bacterium]
MKINASSEKTLKKHSAITDFFIRLVKEKPVGTIGGIIVLILFLAGIFAGQIAPYGMNETNLYDAFQSPSAKYLLGTDQMGRDVLSRVIYGARISLVVGMTATCISVIISVILGILCGYFGGVFDMVAQRFVDAWMCFPSLIFLIIIVSLMGAGMWQVIFAIGLSFGVAGSRIIRGAVISIKENVYMEAAKAIGSSNLRVFMRHILPNIMAPIIVLFTTRLPSVIMTEASLSFLGLGIPPPTPSWGSMLSEEGRSFMLLAPWTAIWPGVALAIVVYGVNMFGDAVRDLLDPRLRGGLGRYNNTKKKKLEKAKAL